MVENSSNTSFASRLAMFNKKKDDQENVETRVKSRTLYQKSSIKIEEKLDQDDLNSISNLKQNNEFKQDELAEIVKSKSINESMLDNTEVPKKENKKIKFEIKETIKNDNDDEKKLNTCKDNTKNKVTEKETSINENYCYNADPVNKSSNENKQPEKKDSKKNLGKKNTMFNFESTKNSLEEMFKKRIISVKPETDVKDAKENNIVEKVDNFNKFKDIDKDIEICKDESKTNENDNIEDNCNNNHYNNEMNINNSIKTYDSESRDLTAFKPNVLAKNKISKPKFNFHTNS